MVTFVSRSSEGSTGESKGWSGATRQADGGRGRGRGDRGGDRFTGGGRGGDRLSGGRRSGDRFSGGGRAGDRASQGPDRRDKPGEFSGDQSGNSFIRRDFQAEHRANTIWGAHSGRSSESSSGGSSYESYEDREARKALWENQRLRHGEVQKARHGLQGSEVLYGVAPLLATLTSRRRVVHGVYMQVCLRRTLCCALLCAALSYSG